MQPGRCNALRSLLGVTNRPYGYQVRQISLTGAIERGIRKGKKVPEGRRKELGEETHTPWQGPPADTQWRPQTLKTTDERSRTYNGRDTQQETSAPQFFPYTQANSEFVHGTFAVSAAIAAHRRALHKLYIYTPEAERSPAADGVENEAKRAGVDVKRVNGKQWLQQFDKMSQGRPHNGYLLEASPLPVPSSISALKACRPISHGRVDPNPAPVLREEHLYSNEGSQQDAPLHKPWRYPFYLFLDQILDPGNLGAIIRSAYFFGVDGIIVPEHHTAPLTGAAVKASAGAIEYLPILQVKRDVEFVRKSQENGWRFHGAVAAEADDSSANSRNAQDHEHHASSALSRAPTVLILGSEAEGIRPRIARHLDQTISIETGALHPGIDSLNVSVAASILIREFLLSYNQLATEVSHPCRF
jgi:predicted rRNA methylase